MKKTLLVALALLACTATFAQFSTPTREALPAKATTAIPEAWDHIAAPFTTQDINGVPVSLADTLAAGKGVVIDYSCAWCGPCWNFHQAGILEAIYNQMGDSICVMWIEVEGSNTTAQITGTSSGSGRDGLTHGDWTRLNGNPVPYRIIDDRTCLNTCASLYEGTVPTLVYIAPSGYYCMIYGQGGLTYSVSIAQNLTNLRNIMAMAPAPNQPPTSVTINSNNVAFAGSTISFAVSYVSVDTVTAINWTFAGADVTTGSGATASTTYSTPGTYTVTVEVVNTTGSTTASKTITVRDGWSFGDEMDYTDGGAYQSALGLSSGAEFEWGVLYPAELMTGRNYVTKVSAYINQGVTGTYTVRIYQGGTTAPNTLIYESPYNVTESGQYVDFPIYGGAQLDPTQSMWVTLSTTGYAASYTTYNGDPNSAMLTLNGSWYDMSTATSGSYEGTWMIKTTTSATQPPFDFVLSGPAKGRTGQNLEFAISGPSGATYTWTIEGATPATATGMTATASWDAAGTFTISVNGDNNGETLSKTLQVLIEKFYFYEDCEGNMPGWIMTDVDGDGYNWVHNGRSETHSGNGNVASQSWVSGVGAINPDNWLISPKIGIPTNQASISWWEYSPETNDYAEHYGLYVSPTGSSNPSNFVLVAEYDIPSSKTWRNVTASLDAYRGQVVRVAFRHFNCTDKFWLILDDFGITGEGTASINEVNNTNISLYPNPTDGKLYINAEGIQEINVIDVNGRTVMNKRNTTTVDMTNLSQGVYFVQVITNNGVSVQKVVRK